MTDLYLYGEGVFRRLHLVNIPGTQAGVKEVVGNYYVSMDKIIFLWGLLKYS